MPGSETSAQFPVPFPIEARRRVQLDAIHRELTACERVLVAL